MLRPPRHFAIVTLGALTFCATSCSRLSTAEKSIIGTWEFTNMHGETGRVVFRRDHSCVHLLPDWYFLGGRMYTSATGTWRLEGDALVSEVQPLPLAGYPELPKRILRMTLPDSQSGIIKDEGHSDLIPASSARLRYAQLLAALFIASSSTMLVAFTYARHRGAMRSVFTWLALGAAAALLYFLLLFVEELAQTGDVIASFDFLRFLRRPLEFLKIACAISFMIGSLKLFRDLKAARNDQRS